MSNRVTIVVLNWNGRNFLKTCLKTLNAHTEYPDYRVVVVDNGSDDGSNDMLRKRFPNVYRIENDENRGFGPANNQAFRQFKDTDYFLLLNHDVEIVQDGWLTEFVNFANRRSADIAGCRLQFPDGQLQHGGGLIRPGWPPVVQISESNVDEIEQDISKVWSPDYVTGAAFLVRQQVVDELNGFDERFHPAYYEETDFCVRAQHRGYNIWYTPEPILIHHEHASTEEQPLFWFHNQLRFVLLDFPLHWLPVQTIYEARGLLGHLYNRRSLRKIYMPILRDILSLLYDRMLR